MKRVVDLRNARDPRYRKVLERIASAGRCPFCPKNFVHHTKPVIFSYGNWFVTRDFEPYPNAREHFLVIGVRHKERLADLTTRDFVEIGRLLKTVERRFNLQGGAVSMRFGNTRYTGATVSHLHCHLIVPKLERRMVDGRKQRLARVVSFPIG